MNTELRSIEDKAEDLVGALLPIWEDAVRATHHFLTEPEIQKIKSYVPQAIGCVEKLVIAYREQVPVGFMGVDGHRLEMLFLAPCAMGQGIGKQLLFYGIQRLGVRELTVNAQNPNAVAFYCHFGFVVYKRTELDETGAPYPLLYMRLADGESK